MTDPFDSFPKAASAPPADPFASFPGKGQASAGGSAKPEEQHHGGNAFTDWLNRPRKSWRDLSAEQQSRGRMEAMRNVAAVGDLVVMGLPQIATSVFANTVGRVVAASYGASRDEAVKFGKEFSGEMANHPIFSPFQKLVEIIRGKSDDKTSVDKIMDKFEELRGKGGDAIEKYTEGAIKREDFELATDALMFAAGEHAKNKAFEGGEKALKPEKSADKPNMFQKISEKYGQNPPVELPPHAEGPSTYQKAWRDDYNLWSLNEGPGSISMTPRDREINAREVANRFMQEGASKAKVESFINRNKALGPLVAKEMDSILSRREDVKTSRLGIVIQGEVLDPLTGEDMHASGKRRMIGEGVKKLAGPAAAVGGLAYYNYAQNANAKDAVLAGMFLAVPFSGRGRSIEELAHLPESAPMSAVLKGEPYTLKTLDRLPQNHHTYTREQVMQQLNRADVGKAEKEVVLQALGGRETVGAKELVFGVRMATGNFELKPVETQEFANYGIDTIRDPGFKPEERGVPLSVEEVQLPPSRTTIYRSPVELGTDNHFRDPNYFAHTRSFDEGGVRHVVELQSDLAQKAGKELSVDERAQLRRALDYAQERMQVIRRQNALVDRGEAPPGTRREPLQPYQLEVREIEAKLAPSKTEPIRLMLKDWHKRLIREEVGEAARRDGGIVRFATADTVAKVEGWPRPREAMRRRIERERGPGGSPDLLQHYQETLAAMPPGEFRTERQGIYDRYKREVEKFLRNEFKAREYTDAHGHTWLEADLPKEARTPRRMFGGADPKFLARVATAGAGAVLAVHLSDQDKLESAIAGGVAGLIASYLPRYARFAVGDVREAIAGVGGIRAAVRAVRETKSYQNTLGTAAVGGIAAAASGGNPVAIALASGLYVGIKSLPKVVREKINGVTMDDLVNMAQGEIAARQRETSNFVHGLRTMIPDVERRIAMARAVESGSMAGLPEIERQGAQAVRDYYRTWGEAAKDAGVINDLLENYVTHLVEKKGGNETFLRGVMAKLQEGSGGGASTFTQYGLGRKYATFEALQKALEGTGLQIKSMDIADVVEAYGRSMGRAIENKRLFTALEAAKDTEGVEGKPLIMDASKAPREYVSVDSPQLRGKLIHPNIADSLKFYAERGNSNGLVKATLALSMAQKRLAVGGSLFHASNLSAAHIAASGRGLRDLVREGTTHITGREAPIKAAISVFRNGGAGDVVDTLIKSGLRLESVAEINPHALEQLGAMGDNVVEKLTGLKSKGLETALGAVEKVQRETFDRVTWDYLHTGGKVLTAMRLLEEQMVRHPELPKEEVARQVSSFVNDTYGGVNWQRIMTESDTKLGRWLSQQALNPTARTISQILMFAPDWTISTFRAAFKALPGATDMPITRQLHQAYVVRSALMYFGLMNALNLITAGHPIWQNKNPLMLELADGRRVQLFKHAMEAAEWAADPAKTLAGKLGYLPKEAAAQLSGKEYLGPHAPDMGESRLSHALSGLAPFTAKGMGDPDKQSGGALQQSLLGALGVQIYGKTAVEREAAKERKKEEKRKKKELEE